MPPRFHSVFGAALLAAATAIGGGCDRPLGWVGGDAGPRWDAAPSPDAGCEDPPCPFACGAGPAEAYHFDATADGDEYRCDALGPGEHALQFGGTLASVGPGVFEVDGDDGTAYEVRHNLPSYGCLRPGQQIDVMLGWSQEPGYACRSHIWVSGRGDGNHILLLAAEGRPESPLFVPSVRAVEVACENGPVSVEGPICFLPLINEALVFDFGDQTLTLEQGESSSLLWEAEAFEVKNARSFRGPLCYEHLQYAWYVSRHCPPD